MSNQDSQVQLEARRWIDSLERKWRLQILSKRFRLDRKTGERREMPLRIRRFAEGIPYACVDEAMRYLLSKAPYRDVVYNGTLIEGEYVPTLTTWKRDDQDVVNGTSRTDGTYTLIQDLIDRLYVDRYMVGTSRSCTEEVVSEWTWDADSIEDIPEENPLQGVTYAIQSVSRNEDGTFDYALVKRVALTQHVERVVTKVTADETVETESWDNLYGEPGAFVDDKGLPVEVPEAGYDAETGSRTEVQITKNDDCTYKAQAVYATDGPARVDPTYVGAASCSEETVYEHHWRDDEVVDVTAYAGQGVSRAVQNLRREDNGTYSYTVVVRRAVTQDSGESVSADTATERTVVRTVDNVYGEPGDWRMFRAGAESPMDPPIPESGTFGGVRTDVQVSRNEDCTYKVQVTSTSSKSVCPAEEQDHKTQYKEETQVRCTGQADPLGPAPEYGGGLTVTHESQLQPDGTYVNRVGTEQERPVPESTVKVDVGRRGRRVTVVDTNQPSPAPVTDVDVGGSVQVEKTPGGLYNNTVTTWDRSERVHAGDYCTEDIFHHQHDVTKAGVPSMPDPEFDHVEDSGKDGLVVARRTDMDDEGSISQTVSKNQEILAPNSEESWRIGSHGVIHTVKHRHVDPLAHPELFGTVPNGGAYDRTKVGSELVRTKTPGGWYDVTISCADRADALKVGVACSKDVFLHTDTTVESAAALPEGEAAHVEDAGIEVVDEYVDGSEDDGRRGVYRSRDARVNNDGTISVTYTQNVELPVTDAQVQDEKNALVRTHISVDRNQPLAAPDVMGELTSDHHLIKKTYSMNKGGSYDVTTETRIPIFRWWRHVTDTNWRWSLTVWFRNATPADVQDLYERVMSVMNAKMQGAQSTYEFSNSKKAFDDDQSDSSDSDSDWAHALTPEIPWDSPGGASETIGTVLVTFNANGGYFPAGGQLTNVDGLNFVTYRLVAGTSLGPIAPTALMSGKRFTGWYTDSEAGTLLADETASSSNATWWAHWQDLEGSEDDGISSGGIGSSASAASGGASYAASLGQLEAGSASGGWLKNFLTVGDNSSWINTYVYENFSTYKLAYDSRIPSDYGVQPSIALNEFGLYDGNFTVSARWDMEAAGQRGKLNVVFHSWYHSEKSLNLGAGPTGVTETVVRRYFASISGRGRALMNAYLTGNSAGRNQGKDFFAGCHVSFHPITQVWSMTLATGWTIFQSGTGFTND